MPETFFDVQWPDGRKHTCYSPSSVVRDYFEAEKTYPLAEFVRLSEASLEQASERVRAKYGYYCSSAADQLAYIKRMAAEFEGHEKPKVTVIRICN